MYVCKWFLSDSMSTSKITCRFLNLPTWLNKSVPDLKIRTINSPINSLPTNLHIIVVGPVQLSTLGDNLRGVVLDWWVTTCSTPGMQIDKRCIFSPRSKLLSFPDIYFGDIVQLGPRSKQSLILKMNTKVAFNTHHHQPPH